MKIKKIKISDYIGIDEFECVADPVLNVFAGPKGTGKSTVLEGIEKAFSNVGRRTELVHHGAKEATLYIETDTGLEIERRIREEKADYLKLRQQGKGVKSTEAELRKFISGDIFRPLDFVNLSSTEQTAIILSMIRMDYTPEEIAGWFGENADTLLSNINTDKHLLQVLKDIEVKKYKEREEVNRGIRELDVQARNIEHELPDNYNGEEWRGKRLQGYYRKVTEAQDINSLIEQAEALQESFQDRIRGIESTAEIKKNAVDSKYRNMADDSKDIIYLSQKKIDEANSAINNAGTTLEAELKNLDYELEKEIQALREQYAEKKQAAREESTRRLEVQKELVAEQRRKIALKEQEIAGFQEKKELEYLNIENELAAEIEREKIQIGKVSEYLKEHKKINVEPLQQEADKIAEMQGYLREWDKMLYIRNGILAEKKGYSEYLTHLITVAREKPAELLQQHTLPLEGISVDEKGLIRVNGTLLDGLSDGEKLEIAFQIALQRMGELKIICLDGFEKLNRTEQKKVVEICEEYDVQAFITVTQDIDAEGFKISNEIGGTNG